MCTHFMIDALTSRAITLMQTLRSGEGLKARALRGGALLGGGSAAESLLRFFLKALLARIILPEAFGIMAIVLAVTAAFEAFTQIGVKESIIQNPKGDERTFLNGAWWVSVVRGLLIYLAAIACVPYVVDFYQSPTLASEGQALAPLLYVALLSIPLTACMSVRAYVALKRMDYARWVIVYHGGGIVGILIAIILGVTLRNVWALVIGFTAEAAARFLLSHLLCPFLPGFAFERESLKALFRYIRGIFGLGILAFVYARIDVIVLGKSVTGTELGLYSLANGLAQFPLLFYSAIFPPVLMPAYAAVQNDQPELTRRLLTATRWLSLAFLPLLTLMACVAPELLLIVFGRSEIVEVAQTFMVLCAAAAATILGRGLATLYFATGRPELNRRASIVRVIVIGVLIVPLAANYGVFGAALAMLCSALAWTGYNLHRLRTIVELSIPKYLASLAAGALISAAIVAIYAVVALVK